MNWRVPLTTLTIGEEEEQAVLRVLRSGWVTSGREVEAFEAEFAEMLGVKYALTIANATGGLALAYDAVGVTDGQEVLMPALTFVASMNVALRRGETPILVDIVGDDDLTMDPEDLRRKITGKTKLIVTMPYGGFAPRMDEIMAVAREAQVPVVEDACHGIGGTFGDRHLGTIGAIGVFSFYGNKNMTTGEGGMLVTNDRSLAERIRVMRNHGMSRSSAEHYAGLHQTYDVKIAGHNFRMDEMRAAMGREQLKKLPAGNLRRAEIAAAIREGITERAPEIRFPFAGVSRGTSSHHLLPALLPEGVDREMFMRSMSDLGVQTSVHYKPLHRFSHTLGLWPEEPTLPVLERIEKRLVTLPLGPGFTGDQVQAVIDAAVSSIP